MDRGPLGILACAGRLPIEIAEAATNTGRGVHLVGIAGFAEPGIAAYSHEFVNLGQIGGMLSSLRGAGCRELVIAGALRRPNLLKVRVDHGFFRAIGTVLRLTRGGDDSVLRRVVRFFESEGFVVVGVDKVAPHLVAGIGALGRIEPRAEHLRAISRASRLLRALGTFDVGQGAVGDGDRIVAIEGVRGTDAMLEQVRAWQADAAGGIGKDRDLGVAVLVKLPKPGQELRVDLPTIGPRTVERAYACGLAGIVVAAGRALVLERAQMVAMADTHGLFVVGIEDGSIASDVAKPDADVPPLLFRPLGWHRAKAPERRDVALGARVLAVLRDHDAGRAVVVVGEHVQGIDAGLGVGRLLSGLGRSSHWGLRVFKRRIGALVVDAIDDIGSDAAGIEATLERVREAGLAGVAVIGESSATPRAALLKEYAGRHRLFALVADVQGAT
ncbi:MAG: UDP-2,3-diacylglucosamine diphosphatase LpxI [Hyphomicrobiaceae bacterium]